MPYTVDAATSGCYEGTTVLINKFGLRDAEALAEVEAAVVPAKAAMWEAKPLCETFDFAHYKSIHRWLFEDLYEWAGEVRTIDLSKKGTMFCPAGEINRVAQAIFSRLKAEKFLVGLEKPEFVLQLTDFYQRTNELHPFREGNGRSMRIWLDCILKKELRKVIDWSRVDKEDYLLAMERSPVKDIEIKYLLKNALTDEIDSREMYMKGIDHSYYYEGYVMYKTEEISNKM